MMRAQLGKGLTDDQIVTRLLVSTAESLKWPVHWLPEIKILPATKEWPRRGVM